MKPYYFIKESPVAQNTGKKHRSEKAMMRKQKRQARHDPVLRRKLIEERCYVISLRQFYDRLGHIGIHKESLRSCDDTISILRDMAATVVREYTREKYREMREAFDTEKRELWDSRTFWVCFACHGIADVRHHVIGLNHGGDNQVANIVALCNECHAKVHPHLASSGFAGSMSRTLENAIDAMLSAAGLGEPALERAAVAMGLAPNGE